MELNDKTVTFIECAKTAQCRLGIGKIEYAQNYLEIDRRAYDRYCSGAVIPDRVFIRAVSLASGKTETAVSRIYTQMLSNFTRTVMPSRGSLR